MKKGKEMEERKESREEFYNNNQLLLAKVDTTYEQISDILNRIIKSVNDVEALDAYIASLTLCKYIAAYNQFSDEDMKWFDYVALRLAEAKVDEIGDCKPDYYS